MLAIVRLILAVYQTQVLTMVLTAAQTTAFFEHTDQMGIPHVTVVQLQAEGITLVSDSLIQQGFTATVGGQPKTPWWTRS